MFNKFEEYNKTNTNKNQKNKNQKNKNQKNVSKGYYFNNLLLNEKKYLSPN